MSKIAPEKTVTPRQRLAIEALALGQDVMDAAQAAGVNRSTLYRWRRDPVFAAELRRIDAEALEQLGRGLMALSAPALEALKRALAEGQPMAIRLRAAQLICERGPALAEMTTVVSRLEEIERALEGR